MSFEDPYLSVFTAPEPLINPKKAKSKALSTEVVVVEIVGSSSQISVKGKRNTKKKKDANVYSLKTWKGEVISLDISLLAYLAPGSSYIVVLLPGSAFFLTN